MLPIAGSRLSISVRKASQFVWNESVSLNLSPGILLDPFSPLCPRFEFGVLELQDIAVFLHGALHAFVESRSGVRFDFYLNADLGVGTLGEQERYFIHNLVEFVLSFDRVKLDCAVEVPPERCSGCFAARSGLVTFSCWAFGRARCSARAAAFGDYRSVLGLCGFGGLQRVRISLRGLRFNE